MGGGDIIKVERTLAPVDRLPGPTEAERSDVARARIFNRLASDSQAAYRREWDRWITFLQNQLGRHFLAATPLHAEKWVAMMTAQGHLAAPARARAVAIVRSVYAQFAREGIVISNPFRETKVRGSGQTVHTPHLSGDELWRVLKLPATTWLERRDHAMIWLLAGTGIRRESIAAILVEDLQPGPPAKVFIRKAKGGKTFTFRLPVKTWREIRLWLDYAQLSPGSPLFPKLRGGGFLAKSTVWELVKARICAAGIEKRRATVHALRRTFATEAYRVAKPLERESVLVEIQMAMGHASLRQTRKYVHLSIMDDIVPGDRFLGVDE